MGNFYTSYTLRGPSQQAVAAALAGRAAIVPPAQDGCVVVFDEESEEQNEEVIGELASRLSGQFNCSLLAVMNHDDSVLRYWLYLSGGLADEYNSAPGYFETEDEDAAMAGPEGGDARKLCEAFGANSIEEVDGILRQPSAVDDGYLFQMERHEDLTRALGIPDFGAGGFEQIDEGELPGGMAEDEWIRTKDLAPGPPLEDLWRKPVPGCYKVNFRAHPKLTTSIPIGWIPNTWAEIGCAEQELSEAFRKAAAVHREKFKQLGFAELGFKRLTRVLNSNNRETGGINFLGGSGRHFGQIIYNRSFIPKVGGEVETVTIAFTVAFPNESFSCTNHVEYLEPVPNQNVIRFKSDDAGFLHEQFVSHLNQRTDLPREFPNQGSVQVWFDATAWETFEYRVQRGSWVRMSDYEVEKARRKLK